MSTSASLLEHATEILKGPGAHSNRAACWIARSALEQAVDELLESKRLSAPEATMRSKLTVLQVAYEREGDLPALAEHAWSGLSQACHHHAFELAPAATEVQHLLQVVRKVVRSANPGRPPDLLPEH